MAETDQAEKLRKHQFTGQNWTNGVVTLPIHPRYGQPGRRIFTDEQREAIKKDWIRRLQDPLSDREALAELAVSVEELHNKLDQLSHYLHCDWRRDNR